MGGPPMMGGPPPGFMPPQGFMGAPPPGPISIPIHSARRRNVSCCVMCRCGPAAAAAFGTRSTAAAAFGPWAAASAARWRWAAAAAAA